MNITRNLFRVLVSVLLFSTAGVSGFAQEHEAVVVPVNAATDLDLSGDIVYAINFGNNGDPNVGGTVFSQDEAHPAVTLDVQGEGPSTWWGPYPTDTQN